MINKICFLLLVLINQDLLAQDARINLWPAGKIPNYRQSAEIEKWDSSRNIAVSLVQTPDIAIYLPTRATATGQAVIICPGGGYRYLSYSLEGTGPAYWLASKGIAAIILKSRLPSTQSNVTAHLSPLMDAKRAVRIVRANASKWGIQKDRIGIMGFSAGGHLAATLATHFDEGNLQSGDSVEQQSSRPDFAILVYPVISMSKRIMHTGSRDRLIGEHPDSSLSILYSNELQVTKSTPPVFLVHAMDDKTVPVENSLLFFQALKDNAVSGELHVFPKGGHGFGLGLGKGQAEQWPGLCIEWLRGLNNK